MLVEISHKILEKLNSSGLDISHINLRDLIDRTVTLKRPSVSVAINNGTAEPITMHSFKQNLDISLIVIFQHLKGEEKAREGIYKIVEAINQALTLQYLGLDLQDPIKPVSFRNITDQTYAEAGFVLYQINLSASYIIEKTDSEEDWGYLTSMLTKYYLQPRDYTGMQGVTGPEACDLIVYDGGSTGLNGCPCAS